MSQKEVYSFNVPTFGKGVVFDGTRPPSLHFPTPFTHLPPPIQWATRSARNSSVSSRRR